MAIVEIVSLAKSLFMNDMNDTPTPRTDKASCNSKAFDSPMGAIDFARTLERELTAAREELDKWEQIAHDKLSEICSQIEKTRVVTDHLTVAREELNMAREYQAYLHKDFSIAIEQRDKLAEALNKMISICSCKTEDIDTVNEIRDFVDTITMHSNP